MSNRRVSFGDRVKLDAPAAAGRGAGAFLPDEPAPAAATNGVPLPIAGNPMSGVEESWEANHKRVTFYCPIDLLQELERATRTTGRSKTQILTEGLQLALHKHTNAGR